jgi:inosose dehydratase
VRVPRLRLGSRPDSWGVWFADDLRQTPWRRFLDELAGVGYEWLELGPYGYVPTDPAQLGDELAGRGLRASGGTMHGFSGLHRAGHFAEILPDRIGYVHINRWPRGSSRSAEEAPDGKEEPS